MSTFKLYGFYIKECKISWGFWGLFCWGFFHGFLTLINWSWVWPQWCLICSHMQFKVKITKEWEFIWMKPKANVCRNLREMEVLCSHSSNYNTAFVGFVWARTRGRETWREADLRRRQNTLWNLDWNLLMWRKSAAEKWELLRKQLERPQVKFILVII